MAWEAAVKGMSGVVERFYAYIDSFIDSAPKPVRYDDTALLSKVAALIIREHGTYLEFTRNNVKYSCEQVPEKRIKLAYEIINAAAMRFAIVHNQYPQKEKFLMMVRKGIICYDNALRQIYGELDPQKLITTLMTIDHAIKRPFEPHTITTNFTQSRLNLIIGQIEDLFEVSKPDLSWQEGYEKELKAKIILAPTTLSETLEVKGNKEEILTRKRKEEKKSDHREDYKKLIEDIRGFIDFQIQERKEKGNSKREDELRNELTKYMADKSNKTENQLWEAFNHAIRMRVNEEYSPSLDNDEELDEIMPENETKLETKTGRMNKAIALPVDEDEVPFSFFSKVEESDDYIVKNFSPINVEYDYKTYCKDYEALDTQIDARLFVRKPLSQPPSLGSSPN